MWSILRDTLVDTLRMIPLLLGIYLVLEYIEARWQQRMVRTVERAGHAGPVLAALGGSVPQCGFSIMASALYAQRLMSMGTIVAVYLATSDEALPILLSRPGNAHTVMILVATKILLAVLGGYLVDVFMQRENARRLATCQNHQQAESLAEQVGQQRCTCSETRASCEHEHGEPLSWPEVIRSALRHTAQITAFIFLASCLIGFAIAGIGQADLARILLGHTMLQPVLAALIGLIPNCAASVAITELYLKGVLSFGSTIAGLGAAGGLGLLVLVRENHDLANTLKVIAWLLGISIAAGMILQLFVR